MMEQIYPVCTGPEVLEADRMMIDQFGIRSIVLMEKAADAVVRAIAESLGNIAGKKFSIVCGSGNNGADGVAIARLLLSRFAFVDVFLVCSKSAKSFDFTSDEGRENLKILRNMSTDSLRIVEYTDTSTLPSFRTYDCVVDALFGAGFKISNGGRKIEDYIVAILSSISRESKFIVSVDYPSGRCPTTGKCELMSPIKANTTVTFGMLKWGMMTSVGKKFCGKIFYSSISYFPEILRSAKTRLIVPKKLRPRNPDGDKRTFGRALFVAGSRKYFGAPFFSTAAFMRCGGGYARLFSLDSQIVYPVVAQKMPEIVFQDEWQEGTSEVVVIGPGLGKTSDSISLLRNVLCECINNPTIIRIVIDGDGLTNLAKAFENNSKNIQNIFQKFFDMGKYIVLTPHVGELKHLFWPSNEESDVPIVEHSVKLESSEEQVTFIDYVYKTREILKNLRGDFSTKLVVVVKGSTSCVVDGTSAIRMNVTGNSGMGTAGSGDVLSGVVANMLIRCSHLDVIDAVANAVWIHGRAGDLARNELGEDGMVASDILDHLPQVMKEMSSETGNPEWNNYYPKIY